MYSDFEDSLDEGTPVELYDFTQGVSRWTYASGAFDLERFSQTFTGLSLKRDRVKQTNDIFKDSLKLTFPRGNEFAAQYLGFAPEDITTVSVLRGHYGDPDDEFIVYWKGRVIGAKANGNNIEIECESIFTSIKRPGLRARFEYSCRHTLYQPGCYANRELYRHDGTIASITGGLSVNVGGASGEADGYYTGGMLVAPSGATRFLTGHTGDVVVLARPLAELSAGMTVAIYPGCDHLKETCNTKFSNLDNFGGFPYIPQRNPFDGSSIV